MKRFLLLVLVAVLAGSACAENRVYMQNPLWSHQVPGRINAIIALNNSLMIGAEDGIYRMDYSKNTDWFHLTGGAVTSIRTWGDDGVLVTSADGLLQMFNMSGKYVWDRQVPGYVGYDTAVDADERGILCGSMDGYVYMFDGNGTYAWKHLVGSYVTNVRMLRDRLIVVSDRQVYILDLDGKVRRNLDITGYIRSADIRDDVIVVGLNDGGVYAYDMNGAPTWSLMLNESVSAIDAGENITIGTREKHLWQFAGNGTVLWTINMTDGVVALKQSQDNILASTFDGKVHIYNSAGILRRYYQSEGRASALDIWDNNIVAGTTTGWVYYSKLPRRDTSTSFVISAAIMVIIAASIIMVSRSWR